MSRRVLMLVPDRHLIDRRVLQQAETLAGAGYAVTLFAGFDCTEEESFTRGGVAIRRLRFDPAYDPASRLAVPGRAGRYLRAVARRAIELVKTGRWGGSAMDRFVFDRTSTVAYDVVHVHDAPLLPVAARLARRAGVPLVFDAHEIYHAQSVLPAASRRRLERSERRTFAAVTLPITVNDGIADYYEKEHGRRPLVLLNATDCDGLSARDEARGALRERAGLATDARVVLYQGWISAERNLDNLVLAAAFLPAGAALVLAGYGDHEAHLRNVVQGAELADRVRFLGRLEPDVLAKLTPGADLGVIPYLPIDLNHRLCSPNKFFEFVQSGVPVVAHDLPFFRAMADRHGVVRLADMSAPESIGTALATLLRSDADRAAMARRCEAAASLLSWKVEAAKLLAAYDRILAVTG